MNIDEGAHWRIAIIGAGAMGGIYASLFAEAGHEVIAIDTWQAHVDAISKQGLHISGASGDRVISTIHAATSISEAADCDLYILATKASGVASAASQLATVMPPQALLLTIQNGLGAIERLGECMPLDNVLQGVAEGFGASVPRPGAVHHNAMKLIRLGEVKGGVTDRLNRLEQLWLDAGFNVKAFADISQLVWEKFVCNVALSGPCAVFDCTLGELHSNPETRDISRGCMLEAYEAGGRENIAFSYDDPIDYLDKFVATMPDSRPSLQQDVAAGRYSEIDAINGMVPVLGKKHGFATPYNSVITATVHSIESRYNR